MNKETLRFSIAIKAPAEKVWDTMLSPSTYTDWTSGFNPAGPGRFEGSWDQGAKILFIGPNPDGTPGEGGMVSRIKENRKHEFISIEHVGMLHDGVEDFTSELALQWIPAFENYTFAHKDGLTEVSVAVDVAAEYKDYFVEPWQKGLQRLKELAEG